MYLDTDFILSLIKEEDWLQSEFDEEVLENPKTSVITAVEVQLVYFEEKSRKFLSQVIEEIESHGIDIVELDKQVMKKSSELLVNHDKLNVFDSIHLAHSDDLEEPIISTDTLYPEIEEVQSKDPRKL